MPAIAIPFDRPLDLRLTLQPHVHGPGDSTILLEPGGAWRTTRTPDGPATVRLIVEAGGVRAEAWGPGADRALEAVPALLGVDDDPSALVPEHPLVRELARRFAGLRIGRTGAVFEALLPAILEQKVTGAQAHRAFRGLIRVYGEVAPGPAPESVPLRLQPSPAVLAGLPYHAFHPFGIERRRADTIRRAAAAARRLEEIAGLPIEQAYHRLTSIPGVGSWTAAEVALRALGDPDAVSIGDFHLPNLVAWALAGEPRGDDTRMLTLLEPYRGQRGRVIRLLEASGIRAPAYGPRLAPRRIEAS